MYHACRAMPCSSPDHTRPGALRIRSAFTGPVGTKLPLVITPQLVHGWAGNGSMSCLAGIMTECRYYGRPGTDCRSVLLAVSLAISLSSCPADRHPDRSACCHARSMTSWAGTLQLCGEVQASVPANFLYSDSVTQYSSIRMPAAALWFMVEQHNHGQAL